MPYCPECKEEFRPEVKTCPTCEIALEAKLSGASADEVDLGDLDVVVTVVQEENAYIIRGFLENEGIPCQLENISFHATPAPAGELTKVRLWAMREDVEAARRLIAEHEQFVTCSACGHVVSSQDTVCDFCDEDLDS